MLKSCPLRKLGHRLAERLTMRANPDKNVGKSEFVSLHRSVNELISRGAFDFDVKAVAPQKNVGCSKCDTLVAIEESMVVP